MRRRKDDVFELGEEQLVEERAVDLVGADDLGEPPPAAQISAEAGSSGASPARTGTPRQAPRLPRLGSWPVPRGAAAAVLVGLCAAVPLVLGASEPPVSTTEATEPQTRAHRSAAEGASQAGLIADREHPSSTALREPRRRPGDLESTVRRQDARWSGVSTAPTPAAVGAADPGPAAGTAQSAAPSSPPHSPAISAAESTRPGPPRAESQEPQPASPAMVIREFGP